MFILTAQKPGTSREDALKQKKEDLQKQLEDVGGKLAPTKKQKKGDLIHTVWNAVAVFLLVAARCC